ncbi:hypothetical protein K438DRAFT_1967393 [Mycena galopus ATCC 62051]|nr:hypothetical protein K438DRAFT_1967393 [Mycena galopus ATCC 62051]
MKPIIFAVAVTARTRLYETYTRVAVLKQTQVNNPLWNQDRPQPTRALGLEELTGEESMSDPKRHEPQLRPPDPAAIIFELPAGQADGRLAQDDLRFLRISDERRSRSSSASASASGYEYDHAPTSSGPGRASDPGLASAYTSFSTPTYSDDELASFVLDFSPTCQFDDAASTHGLKDEGGTVQNRVRMLTRNPPQDDHRNPPRGHPSRSAPRDSSPTCIAASQHCPFPQSHRPSPVLHSCSLLRTRCSRKPRPRIGATSVSCGLAPSASSISSGNPCPPQASTKAASLLTALIRDAAAQVQCGTRTGIGSVAAEPECSQVQGISGRAVDLPSSTSFSPLGSTREQNVWEELLAARAHSRLTLASTPSMAAELAVAPSARAGEGRTSAIRAREYGLEPQASAPIGDSNVIRYSDQQAMLPALLPFVRISVTCVIDHTDARDATFLRAEALESARVFPPASGHAVWIGRAATTSAHPTRLAVPECGLRPQASALTAFISALIIFRAVLSSSSARFSLLACNILTSKLFDNTIDDLQLGVWRPDTPRVSYCVGHPRYGAVSGLLTRSRVSHKDFAPDTGNVGTADPASDMIRVRLKGSRPSLDCVVSHLALLPIFLRTRLPQANAAGEYKARRRRDPEVASYFRWAVSPLATLHMLLVLLENENKGVTPRLPTTFHPALPVSAPLIAPAVRQGPARPRPPRMAHPPLLPRTSATTSFPSCPLLRDLQALESGAVCGAGYHVLYFSVVGVWGIHSMLHSRTGWFDTRAFWAAYPPTYPPGSLKAYYLAQIAYWLL